MGKSAPEQLIGRTIAVKFLIEAAIGAGAMGAVFRARQIALEKTVAIKVLHGEHADDASFVTRFQREAKAASRLNHPNSMQVIDYGAEPDGLLYIAMEYLDGRSLHRRLAVDGAGDELMRLNETLNEMIARLETSFGALRRFTADASHELKTPLAVLRADVERAMSASPQSNEQLIALEEALQETRRMSDLVDSLLTLARADEGRFDVVREPVALEPLVREVFESAVILGEDAGLTVSLPVVEPATVLGDAPRLRQLCMNLVMNAVKYTPRGGRIDVSLSHRLDGVTFSVRDTGVGIGATDLPHIFERFWRADRVRSRASERGGFGLGLAISQWIAQAHGGSITATSRLGRGSLFTVHLPAVADGSTAVAESVPAGTRSSGGSGF